MTADEYRESIEQLGLSQIAAAKLLGVDCQIPADRGSDPRSPRLRGDLMAQLILELARRLATPDPLPVAPPREAPPAPIEPPAAKPKRKKAK